MNKTRASNPRSSADTNTGLSDMSDILVPRVITCLCWSRNIVVSLCPLTLKNVQAHNMFDTIYLHYITLQPQLCCCFSGAVQFVLHPLGSAAVVDFRKPVGTSSQALHPPLNMPSFLKIEPTINSVLATATFSPLQWRLHPMKSWSRRVQTSRPIAAATQSAHCPLFPSPTL